MVMVTVHPEAVRREKRNVVEGRITYVQTITSSKAVSEGVKVQFYLAQIILHVRLNKTDT